MQTRLFDELLISIYDTCIFINFILQM